jgi:hypothetical protein
MTALIAAPTRLPKTAPAPRPSAALIASLEDGLRNIQRNAAPAASSLAKYPAGKLSSSDTFQIDQLRNQTSIGAMYMDKASSLRAQMDSELGTQTPAGTIRTELIFLGANSTRMGAVSGFLDAVVGYGEIKSADRQLKPLARFSASVEESSERALDAMKTLGWIK